MVDVTKTKIPKMRRCPKCWTYTFKERCPVCGSETIIPHPKPFNISPSYAKSKSLI